MVRGIFASMGTFALGLFAVVLIGCGAGGAGTTLEGVVETLGPSRHSVLRGGLYRFAAFRQRQYVPVEGAQVSVYLSGQLVAGPVETRADGSFSLTLTLPQGFDRAALVVRAAFSLNGQRKVHKAIVIAVKGQRHQVRINPEETLIASVFTSPDNPHEVPVELDEDIIRVVSQRVRDALRLKDLEIETIDFSDDEKILVTMPVMLVITSNPSGAEIFIDGDSEGQTPLVLIGRLRGQTSVTLQARFETELPESLFGRGITVTTTLSETLILRGYGATPIHFNFKPEIVEVTVQGGEPVIQLRVRNAGQIGEKIGVIFGDLGFPAAMGDLKVAVGQVVSLDANGVAAVDVSLPDGLSGQVPVRVINASQLMSEARVIPFTLQ